MSSVKLSLTVFYDQQFWIGIFEKVEDKQYSVAKVTFGAKPKDSEILDFICQDFHQLKFSPTLSYDRLESKQNYKQMKRNAKKEVESIGVGTKSQQALKNEQETRKIQRKVKSKKDREEEQKKRFELRQMKRKEKHRGH